MRFLPYREIPQSEHQHNILIFNDLKYTNNKNSIRYKNQAVTEYFIDKKRQNKNISLVDSYNTAIYSYCSVVNMLIEIFLSGMTFEQSLSSRLVAIPVNILIAWPYGMYRDLFMKASRKVGSAGWLKNLADVLAYVTFQSPVYVAILLTVGADWHQITAAVSSNIVISMMMGAVYGYFLDYCRRLFKVSRYQQVKA